MKGRFDSGAGFFFWGFSVATALLVIGCGGSDTDATQAGGSSGTPAGGSTCTIAIDPERALALINAARSTGRHCGDAFYPATTPLTWDRQLQQAAQRHADDMSSHGYLAHIGTDGSAPADRVTDAGYRWMTVAENVAAGYDSLEDAMNGWIESPGHCANLMNPNLKHYGVACSSNPDSPLGVYWTQVFAGPR